MNLYKLFSKNPYYFWAVMSIVMQVHVLVIVIVVLVIFIEAALDYQEHLKKNDKFHVMLNNKTLALLFFYYL